MFPTIRLPALRTLGLMVVLATVSGCGQTSFSGSGGTKSADGSRRQGPASPNGPENSPGPSIEGERAASLTWFWQCDQTKDQIPPGDAKNPVMSGGGTHDTDPNLFSGVPLIFAGTLCEPTVMPRDIVFVVDVSGSMTDNDPLSLGTCGRLKAVEQVIAGLPASSGAQFAIVTFGTDVVKASKGFFSTRETLYTDIAGGPDASAVVCEEYGDTNYRAGLVQAQTLLQAGRAQATKEVYFVSDGVPGFGLEGYDIAAFLKKPGVNIGGKLIPASIATVMLGSADDAKLRDGIASRSQSGIPLHARADASQLAAVLADLAKNGIQEGTLKYRAVGTAMWTSVDLMTYLKGFNFTLPSIKIDMTSAPQGIEVLYEYRDKHGTKYSSGGTLVWSIGASLGLF